MLSVFPYRKQGQRAVCLHLFEHICDIQKITVKLSTKVKCSRTSLYLLLKNKSAVKNVQLKTKQFFLYEATDIKSFLATNCENGWNKYGRMARLQRYSMQRISEFLPVMLSLSLSNLRRPLLHSHYIQVTTCDTCDLNVLVSQDS